MQRRVRRADYTTLRSQRGATYFRLRRNRAERALADLDRHGLSHVGQRTCDSAADDHQLGIEGVEERRDRDSKIVTRDGKYLERHRIAASCLGGKSAHRKIVLRIDDCSGQLRTLCESHLSLDESAQSRRRRVRFKTSARPTVASRTLGFDRHVSEFTCHSTAAMDQLAADDDSAADSGAEREQYNVAPSACRTAPVLAERPRVGIILEHDRSPDQFFELAPERISAPCRDMGRRLYDSRMHVERTRHRDPDSARRAEPALARGVEQMKK